MLVALRFVSFLDSRLHPVFMSLPLCVHQDPDNDVRKMGDHLAALFEEKYAEFLQQQEEERVCTRFSLYSCLTVS